MKVTGKIAEKIVKLLLVSWAGCLVTGLHAQTLQGTVEVRGVMGSATYSAAGSAAMPLRARTAIPIGCVIKTASGAAIDLAFSHNAGVVRLLQNSTLSLDKFATEATPGAGVDISLYLIEGTLVGFDKRLSNTSKYQIKVSDGIAEVSGSKYRISAQGYLVLIEGSALFVFVPPGGEPVPFELQAPAPVYFSPVEGVRPAPLELVREVVLQTKGQLRSR